MFIKSLKSFFSTDLYNPSLFRTVYLVNLFLCSVCFWNIAGVAVNVLLFIWSAIILVDLFFLKKDMRKIRHGVLLVIFLALGLYTSVFHIDGNFAENIVMLYHAAICFFLFYGMHSESNPEKRKQEIDRILKLMVFLTTIFSVLGLLIVFLAPTGRIYLGSYVLGIMDNRFTGLYTNPNLAAFSSVIGIVCCHILYKRNPVSACKKKCIPRMVSILCVAANLLSLLLSDSNSSLVFGVSYVVVYLFCRFYQKSNGYSFKKTVLRGGALLLCGVLIAGFALMFRMISQTAVTGFVNTVSQIHVSQQSTSENQTASAAEKTSVQNIEIGRTEEYEISSGRIDSLKKSMVLFRKFPLLGVGKGNIILYGERYMLDGFTYSDLHNGFLTILISDGIAGFVIFMLFLSLVGFRLLRCFRYNRGRDLKEIPALIAAVTAYCIFGLFEKAVLFDITFMVVIFWMLLGHTSALLAEYEWQEDMVGKFALLRLGRNYSPGFAYSVAPRESSATDYMPLELEEGQYVVRIDPMDVYSPQNASAIRIRKNEREKVRAGPSP